MGGSSLFCGCSFWGLARETNRTTEIRVETMSKRGSALQGLKCPGFGAGQGFSSRFGIGRRGFCGPNSVNPKNLNMRCLVPKNFNMWHDI